MKMLDETSLAAVLLEYKEEGMDVEAAACRIKQRFPNVQIILISAYSEMPERVLWLVDRIRDEERTAGTAGPDHRTSIKMPATVGRNGVTVTEQGEKMPTNESFTVGESAALLRAIFLRYPDLRGMKPTPDVGVFLLDSLSPHRWSLRLRLAS